MGRNERPRESGSRGGGALVATLLAAVLVMTGCSSSGDGQPRDDAMVQTPVEEPGLVVDGAELWLSFDESEVGFNGSTEYADAQGAAWAGRVITANGGGVTEAPGGEGRGTALAFPEKCTDDSGCPRAMVEVGADPALEPGDRPFVFGASVRLAADQTADGSNVMQSGRFGSKGGQWKLQVDGDKGVPSCIFRSGDTVERIYSTTSVADDMWHRVDCERDDRGISIAVDGVERERAVDLGSVDSGLPIRIGSPGVGDDDDQFHGAIDDVVLDIEPTS